MNALPTDVCRPENQIYACFLELRETGRAAWVYVELSSGEIFWRGNFFNLSEDNSENFKSNLRLSELTGHASAAWVLFVWPNSWEQSWIFDMFRIAVMAHSSTVLVHDGVFSLVCNQGLLLLLVANDTVAEAMKLDLLQEDTQEFLWKNFLGWKMEEKFLIQSMRKLCMINGYSEDQSGMTEPPSRAPKCEAELTSISFCFHENSIV